MEYTYIPQSTTGAKMNIIVYHKNRTDSEKCFLLQVTVQVTIPQRLSKEERKLVEELAALGSGAPKGSGKGGKWL